MACAFGAHVVLFRTSPSKVEEGKRLGSHEVVVSGIGKEMESHAGYFDFILDCVLPDHDMNAYLRLLKLDGTLCPVGAPERPLPIAAFSMLLHPKQFVGSAIGGIAETREMLDFCFARGIENDAEWSPFQMINEAYDRLAKKNVRYRYVIGMASLKY